MTELRAVLTHPDIQAKIADEKKRIQEYREAVDAGRKERHTSLLTDWNRDHQAIVERYIGEIVTMVDRTLEGLPANLSGKDAFAKFSAIEEKRSELPKLADKYKRQFDTLVKGDYFRESPNHGGPLSFLFDSVGRKVVTVVFKLRFGNP